MPFTAKLAWIAALVAGLAAHQEARALYLAGTFSGVAAATELPLSFTPPVPISFYDGAPVTGSFELNVSSPTATTNGAGFAYFANGDAGWLKLSYVIEGTHFDYAVGLPPAASGEHGVILLSDPTGVPGQQSATFLTDTQPKYQGASFTLTGASGSIFSSLDATSLHFDAAAAPAFTTSFANAAAEMGVDVAVNQVTFQTVPAVPEPASWALLALGGLTLMCRKRRQPFGAPRSEAADLNNFGISPSHMVRLLPYSSGLSNSA